MRDLLRRLIKIVAAVALLFAVIQVARRLLSSPEPAPVTPPDWPPLEPSTESGSATAAEPAASDEASASDEVVEASEAWVEPDDGSCPSGHPVKAKNSSKIFHVPGGGSYDRTKADRCYLDAAAAEADGYRQSKV